MTQKTSTKILKITNKIPEITKVFPALIASREDQIKILDNEKLPNFIFNNFEFDKKILNRNDVNDFIIFFEKKT